MDDKALIELVHGLKEIKPREEWVILTKKRILGETAGKGRLTSIIEILPRLSFRFVLAPAMAFGMLFGLMIVARHALPGDYLYPIKRAVERAESVFVSDTDRPKEKIELTDKRLEELTKIAETNQVRKLAPALSELAATKAEAKTEVLNLVKTKPEKGAAEAARGIALRLKEVGEREDKILATLGIEPREDNDSAEKAVAELLIKDAEKSTLNERQAEYLKGAKECFEAGDYHQALQKLLFLSYSQS